MKKVARHPAEKKKTQKKQYLSKGRWSYRVNSELAFDKGTSNIHKVSGACDILHFGFIVQIYIWECPLCESEKSEKSAVEVISGYLASACH